MSDDPQAQPAPPTPATKEYEKPQGILGLIERIGNMLPDPATLFLLGTLFIMGLSHYAVQQNWTVTKALPVPVMEDYTAADGTAAQRPALNEEGQPRVEWKDQTLPDGAPEEYRAESLLTGKGLFWALNSMVKNFTSFDPLGVVLVGMLGIGIAERVGLIAALLKAFMIIVPRFLLTPAMVFLGIMSSAGIDAGYVVLPPLAAALYKAAGRSPLAGLAAVFSGVAAGFNANLFPTGLDPMLAGFATTGAQVIDPTYEVNPASNWWFMIASTVVMTLVGWWVTATFVERRMLNRSPEDGGPVTPSAEDLAAQRITGRESLGLIVAFAIFAGIATTIYYAITKDGWALFGKGPAFDRWAHAIVPIIFMTFLLPALGFGLVSGKVKGDKSVAKMFNESIAGMAPIIVLAFFAAQFIEHFKYSGLDKMLALAGGQYLGQAELSKEFLMVAFIGVTMFFNLLIGSMSAKYAMFAPIFIPMFMLVGISPELTQAAYRIGDSATNIITPLNAYLVIVLVFMRQFVPKAGMGTLIATMLPYTIFFALAWTIMLVIWMATGQPLGPDGELEYVLQLGG